MKKQFLLAVVVMSVTFGANAISASYRAQLESSGCTQVTDGHGCDSHKTKAQNSAAEHSAEKHKYSLDEISSEVDTVINTEYGEGANYLLDKGWRPSGLHEYMKAGWQMRIVVEAGAIVNAQIIGKAK